MRSKSAIPKVSIVIPTFNTGNFILEALTSVENQDYPNLEIIIVNDGSTDSTEALLDQHGGNAIRFYQENAGQSAAVNFGWRQSSGDIIGYLSADDRLHPGAVTAMTQALTSHPGTVLAYPDFCIIDENSHTKKINKLPEYTDKELIGKFRCIPGPGALFLRTAWATAGDWDTTLRNMPDMDFFLRLCRLGSFVRVARPLADFRIHSNSTTYSPCTPERADEPLRIAARFYQSNLLPENILKLRNETTANALMLSGYMHGFSGRHTTFAKRICKAMTTYPRAIISKTMLSYLAGIARSLK